MEEEKTEIMTEDEAYAKAETEKLLRSKKKRRIYTSIAMGFAFALAIVLIVLSTVPVSLRPACVENDYVTVRFSDSSWGVYGGSISGEEPTQAKKFAKFQDVFNDSFSQTYISAIFSGTLTNYTISEEYRDFSSAKSELQTNGTKYVALYYNDAKTIKNPNGSRYVSNGYATEDSVLTFKTAFVSVNSTEGFQNTKIYLETTYPGQTGKLIVITVKANTHRIYEAWDDLVA
ncbi:MAG: hypothetical protein IJ817_04105 [Clostridia bacterium]|nr:hypothetical protein [Clostridia bacterium]